MGESSDITDHYCNHQTLQNIRDLKRDNIFVDTTNSIESYSMNAVTLYISQKNMKKLDCEESE